jgi:hypothetical protein
MSKIRALLLSGMSALGLTVGTSNVAFAQSEYDIAEAERACERALEIGTIEALEDYLFRYPEAPTACRARALNTLSAFGGDENPDPPDRGIRDANTPPGYGG